MTATITTRTTAPPTGEGTAKGTPLTNLEMDSNLNSLISRSYASDTVGTAAFTVVDSYYELVSKGIKFVRIAGTPTATGTAVSFNINGKGVKNLKFMDGAQVYDFHLREEDVLQVMYDGTDYIWLNPINRVLDFSAYAGSNYQLRVGESARYVFVSTANQTLKLAIAAGQIYEVEALTSSLASATGFELVVNNNPQTIYNEFSAITSSPSYGLSSASYTGNPGIGIGAETGIATTVLHVNSAGLHNWSRNRQGPVGVAYHIQGFQLVNITTDVAGSPSTAPTEFTKLTNASGFTYTGNVLFTRIA